MALFEKKKTEEEQAQEISAVAGNTADATPASAEAAKAKPFVARPAAPFKLSMLYRELVSLISLNLMFVFSCIPIITIPAALTAMNRITCTMVQDQNYFLWQDYWKTFKREFGKSLLGGLVFGIAFGLFLLAGFVYYNIFGKSFLFTIILAFTACFLIIIYLASTYYWTMLAFVDLPFKALLKNSLIMVLGCWKRSLIALVIIAAHLFFAVGLAPVTVGYSTTLTDVWVFVVFLVLFSANSLLLNYAIWPAIYEKVVKPEEREKKSAATQFGTKEKITWDNENEIQSASAANLNWEDDK